MRKIGARGWYLFPLRLSRFTLVLPFYPFPLMPDRYAVFGNPIAHSRSPLIHAAFATQTGQDMTYEAILAPLEGFVAAIDAFRAAGGRGGNVTVPFKEQAFQLCEPSARAREAGAANTLWFSEGRIHGDNTDGAGLIADLVGNLGFALAGKRVLLMGAGGAARGVLGPLLRAGIEGLVIANRTPEKAVALARQFAGSQAEPAGCAYDAVGQGFDLVINATAASLAGELPPLPEAVFASGALAYDMMYGRDTPFLAFARARGCAVADGAGMLVEQAAEAFWLWRGVRPDTLPVLRLLRGE